MKNIKQKIILALGLLLLVCSTPSIAQEKKTRPEPPGPDPVTTPAKNNTATSEKTKSEPKPTPNRTGNWYIRQSPDLLKALEPISKASKGTTVKVVAKIKTNNKEEEGQVSLGTVVDAAGYIVTKASRIRSLGKTLQVEINGKKVPAKVFGIHQGSDLAMLKVEPAGLELKPVQWRNQTPEVGHLLTTPDADANPLAFGVLSVASREERDTRGFMGVNLEDAGEKEKGSVVIRVTPKSPAAYAGLRIGDLILQVNGQEINNTPDLIAKVSKHKPGETVKIKLKRDEKELEKSVTLGDRSSLGILRPLNPQETIAGNKLSKRRTGFDRVIQHDSVIGPENMGGPILNLEGRAIGLNIAKNGRVSTYALPLSVLQPAINELRSGKLDPATVHKPRLDQITSLIKEKEKQIADSKLREKAAEAEKKLAEATKAFEDAEREYKKLQQELEDAGKKKFRADAKQKETHAENRSIKRELSGAQKEIDELKKEKEQLESTFK